MQSNSKRLLVQFVAIILISVFAGLSGAAISRWVFDPGKSGPRLGAQLPEADRSGISPAAFESSLVGIVESVGPAVVKIATTQSVIVDNMFYQITEKREGIGSGVIFDEKGYILTNNHVVEGATDINVFVPGGLSMPGKVVGRDPLTDLAVVKVTPDDGQGLRVAELGDSSNLKVGQFVVAIGNPFRFDNSVTTGVVSALGRDIAIDPELNLDLKDMIQTDASINPGNSGGPLLDSSGNVIGINTAIFSPAQGIGFAIPVNAAKDVAQQLIEHGKVIRLGIIGGTLTPDMVEALERETRTRLPVQRGAYVLKVLSGTPAAKAGVQERDIITVAGGTEIRTMEELTQVVRKTGFGGRLKLELYRVGKRVDVETRLE